MTFEMALTLGILALAILLFITEWVRVDVVALGVLVTLMATGTLTTEEALSGFSNPAVLTIAALFIVGGAVLQTGLAGTIGRRILRVAGESPARLTTVIMITVALLSGFMSDTGTVAVLLPAIIALSKTTRIAPSRLLIPLSFGALLGGAATLIGTTPNIIVSDILNEAGYEPFGFFSFTPLGLVLLGFGVLYMLGFGRRLLPDRRTERDLDRVATPQELIDLYQLPNNLYRLRVRRNSPVIGKSVVDLGVRTNYGITAVDLMRTTVGEPRWQEAEVEEGILVLQPETALQDQDVLVVQGEADNIAHFAAVFNLGVQIVGADEDAGLINQEVGIAEVLLPPRSSLLGKTIVEANFGRRYKLTVLGIFGPSAQEKLDVRSTQLRFGDILLVQGQWKHILALRESRRDFVVMGQPEAMLAAPARRRAPVALAIMLGMLLLMIGEVFPLAATAMLAALMVILTGCLTIDDAYEAIDWKSIVLIAGMLPMSIALEKVGLVSVAAEALTMGLGALGPRTVLLILFLATSLFTQVLSNTATTVLIAPIALEAAVSLGLRPEAFLMGVAVAASMAFASPVASPANTLVMGAGEYQFSDYLRVGLPLIGLMALISVILLPLLFKF